MEDIALAALPREVESEGESDGDADNSSRNSSEPSTFVLPQIRYDDDPILSTERWKIVADVMDQL